MPARGEDADHLVEDVGGQGQGVGAQATEEDGVQGEDGHVDFGKDAPELGLLVPADGGVGLDAVFAGAELGEGDEGDARGEIEEISDGNDDGRLGGHPEILDQLADKAGKSLGAGSDAGPGRELVGLVTSSEGLTVGTDHVHPVASGGFPGLPDGTKNLVGGGMGLLDVSLDALHPLVTAAVLGRRVVKHYKQRTCTLSQALGNDGGVGHGGSDIRLEGSADLGVEGSCGGRVQGHDLGERAGNSVDKGQRDLGGLVRGRRLDEVQHGSDEAGKGGRGHLSNQCLVALEERVDLGQGDDT